MPNYNDAISRQPSDKAGEIPSVNDFGGDLQKAVNAVNSAGGGTVLIPGKVTVTISAATGLTIPSNVVVIGQGDSSVIKIGTTLNDGYGLINYSGSNSGIDNLLILGTTTLPTHLAYADFSSDPMNTLLTKNSSVWIKSGANNIRHNRVKVKNTGGYSFLIDADSADVSNILFDDVYLEDCSPHCFGTSVTAANNIYGAWTGGLFYRGDCRNSSAKPYRVKNLTVNNLKAKRCNGNIIWGHSYGFDVQHQNLIITNCWFEDIGRDPILLGNVDGAVVEGNVGHRIGYTRTDSVSAFNPAYLTDNYAVFIDCSGFVKNALIKNNTCRSFNGGFIDLDGARDSIIEGNTGYIPANTDTSYTEDQILSYPVYGSSNSSKGIQTGNTQQNGGAKNVVITNNRIQNCGVNAIVLAFGKNCLVKSNHIEHPSGAGAIPIELLASSSGSGNELLCFNNYIESNIINYAAANICIAETGSGWTSSHTNRIFNNIISAGNNGEFLRNSSSTSYVGVRISSNDSTVNNVSDTVIERQGFNSTAAFKISKYIGSTKTQILQLQDSNYLLNVSNNGSATSGNIATGNRTTVAFDDTVASGHFYSDRAIVFKALASAPTELDVTLETSSLGTSGYCGLYYGTDGKIYKSVATTVGGTRVWTELVAGAGGGTPGGLNTHVQYNNSGAFGGDAQLTWDKTARIFTVTGSSGTPSIVAADSYIQSAQGFLCNRNDGGSCFTLQRSSATAGVYEFAVGSDGYIYLTKTNTGNLIFHVRASSANAGSNITIGDGISGNRVSLIDFVADDTYTDYGLRLIRWNTGPNAISELVHRGTGPLTLTAQDAGSVEIKTSSVTRFSITSAGLISIGSTVQIDQAGAISATGVIAANGGVTSSISGNYAFNAPSGWMYVDRAIADAAIYLKTLASSPADPAGGYGALSHKSGSTYRYWNGSAWADVNLSTAGGGVTQLNSMTGSITIQGTLNRVTVSSGGGVITLSAPQDLHTSAQPTFNAMAITNSAANAFQCTSGGILVATSVVSSLTGANVAFQAGGGNFQAYGNGNINGLNINAASALQINGVIVVDSGRNVNGTSILVGSNTMINSFGQFVGFGITMTAYGCGASGYNVYSGGWYYGRTATITVVTSVNFVAQTVTTDTLNVKGGIITI